MKKIAKTQKTRAAIHELDTTELAHVNGGVHETDGGNGYDAYAWEGRGNFTSIPPTIPDIGWDSYFWV